MRNQPYLAYNLNFFLRLIPLLHCRTMSRLHI